MIQKKQQEEERKQKEKEEAERKVKSMENYIWFKILIQKQEEKERKQREKEEAELKVKFEIENDEMHGFFYTSTPIFSNKILYDKYSWKRSTPFYSHK